MRDSLLNGLITTLIINGYHLKDFKRLGGSYKLMDLYKYDSFGAEIRYSVLVTSKTPTNGAVEALRKATKRYNSKAFILNSNSTSLELEFDTYTFDNFYEKIGGHVNTGLVLNKNLTGVLESLGLNNLPDGLSGRPDDLLEIYSKECFQFLFNSSARRFGKDRLYESLPDGVILTNDSYAFLFDSKAYTNGYSFSSDDINRFEKYVKEFQKKYSSSYLIKSFIVVSGKFNDSESSVSDRSDDLLARVQVPISSIKSGDLGMIIKSILKNPKLRLSIDWNKVFVKSTVRLADVESQIKALSKDQITQ